MTKRTVTFFMLLAVCMLVHAQTYRIEGTVIDKTSRKPLEFVNVLVVGLGIQSNGASFIQESEVMDLY